MAVVIQKMIQAKCAGVMYTQHPVEKKYILVEAAFGIGDSVVDGVIKPDSFLIDRESLTIVSKEVGTKRTKTELRDDSHATSNNEETESFSVDDGTIQRLVSIGLDIEISFGSTQNIEWAYDGSLWFLQSRTVKF
jgi:pyruvate,water dikinase